MQDNLETYNSTHVVHWYDGFSGLMPVEKSIFERHFKSDKCGNLLDIGIGAGRTTAHLLNYCKQYVGIDYSENLIQKAKLKFVELDLRCMNAVDLGTFSEGSFDFVNFSFNGIDYASLDDRAKILSEINRVLKPGGVFFFSTHNKNAHNFNLSPWLNSKNSAWINLKTFLKLLPYMRRHFKKRKFEIYEKEYAVINNCAHNYGLMTFHSTPEFVKKQLDKQGFDGVEFYNLAGERTDDSSTDEWLFVVCKKTISA
ncbi:MAG: class I SAM-dependent methyltransferase [Bacteroidetes bacterium]|nr:class I SAM-dependent methyltransferase [Bacteroidota bacterium]